MKTGILKPQANVRSIVGQELPALFGCMLLAFAHSCCMLLRVVGTCCARFETGQTLSYVKTDSTSLANNSQH